MVDFVGSWYTGYKTLSEW